MPTVVLPAGPLDYTDTGGRGPVLVFGHGLLMNESQWRKVIPQLDAYRCIAPTLPLGAHRRPMNRDADLSQLGVARILADFLDALELSDVTLVLNDWGGGQFIVSDNRADRLGRLVLISCEAFDNFPPKPARPLAALCRIPGGTRLLMQLFRTRFFRHDPKTYGGLSKRGVPDDIMDDWFSPASDDRKIRRDLSKFATGTPSRKSLLKWSSRLATFDRPALVVWATEDRMMPLQHAHRLVELLPNAELIMIDDSWTLIPEDQPGALIAALKGFVPIH
ncbi:alpha/beta hydrolase [Rhodococcus sp. G-MC3]|uniref:alpha/beta fold hydrolase n=1 Tax=Rhodococcus sp. G-MC3 TaxID=3046209 RepID=UPI0024B9DBC4|nr:alpha/beta hydrolase [Rhodococcus sp. G-MC3]MDJ0394070.1 alpha/beta hydrolase [Rhodococcus sp. G-MC3]